MCVTICGRFRPDEGAVAGYGNRIRLKYTAKWGVQIAGLLFQTRSSVARHAFFHPPSIHVSCLISVVTHKTIYTHIHIR